MKIGIIHIGDELLTGKINPYPFEMISAIQSKNAEVSSIQIITDDIDIIVKALDHSQKSDIDLLIVTGGLGPTLDDLTREAVAEYMGVDLEIDKKMVRIPKGSTAVHNICGAACGIKAQAGKMTIFCLPGFPNEMMPMFEESILPLIIGNEEVSEELTTFVNESDIDPYLRQISEKYHVRVASLPSLEWKTKGNKVVIKGRKEEVLAARKELENCINSL